MPSSSSSSSVQILDSSSSRVVEPTSARAAGTITDGSGADDDGGGGTAAALIASSFQSQKPLDALCEKHGVDTKEFTPLPAGNRRACSPPPAGAVCVYADALEAGMRFPLHPFFCEVLSHFGVAPSQLTPNSWRAMAGFLALSRSTGVQPPSVAVFRHFFALRASKVRGWYCFYGKDTAGPALFTGLRNSIKGWKERFFFLKSPATWQCPVLWGEPTKSSGAEPALTREEESMAGKLLRERGATAIDLRAYLSESAIAAATMISRAPTPPSPSPRTTTAKGMDPSTYSMMQKMRAENAAVQMPADEVTVSVKSEPGGSDTPGMAAPVSRKKRKPSEDNAEQGTWPFEQKRQGSVPCASPPPGFTKPQDGPKPQHAPDRHDGDTADWETARQLLQAIVTPPREWAFSTARPSDVIATSYVAMLQAANYASFSLGHALKLQEELEKAKAEAESAKAAAVREFLGSKEHERRLVEEALRGYERGMEDMKRVALRLRPDIDPARLFVPLGGFR